MTAHTVIAIDSGQTAIKVRLGGQESLSFPGLRANSSPLPQIADVVGRVVEHAGAGPFKVYVGTCGFSQRDNDPEELLRLCEPYGVDSVLLAHDAVTSFLGAIGDRRGVVVAAVSHGLGWHSFGVARRCTALSVPLDAVSVESRRAARQAVELTHRGGPTR